MGLKLMAEVGLDGSGFERGLHKLGHEGSHHLKNLVAGAFGVYSVHQAIHRTIEAAEELVTASKRLDVTVEQLQVMRQAAKESHVEFGKLAGALEKINLARAKALSGDSKKLAAFARFGVSKEDLQSMTAANLFSGPMAGAVRSNSAQDMTAAGAAIFGMKGFGSLIPVLKTDFQGLQEKMESLGSIMSTEAAVAIKVTAEEFGLLSNIIVAQLAPALALVGPALLQLWGAAKGYAAYLVGLATNNPATIKDWLVTGLAGIESFLGGNPDKNPSVIASTDRVLAAVMNAEDDKHEEDEIQHKLQEEFAHHIAKMVDELKHPPIPTNAPFAPKVAKKERIKQMASDSLVSVGNFLGAGAGLVNSIAQKQLDVAEQQLEAQKEGNEKLESLADIISDLNGDGIDVP